MPRTRVLTWQQGAGGRPGRWRKKYRGRVIYLGTAPSKSDVDAYRKAMDAWKTEKARIDAEEAAKPRPHQEQYEAVIREWETVLQWSVEHGDDRHAVLARERLADLRERLQRKSPPPITMNDRLWSRYTWPEHLLESVASAIAEGGTAIATDHGLDIDSPSVVVPGEKAERLDGSPNRISREIWRDRLDHQRVPDSPAQARTIGDHLATFLAKEQKRVSAGKLSAGRFTSKRSNLESFAEWLGRNASPDAITGQMLLDFHSLLIGRIDAGTLASDTAHNRMLDVKAFIRWLWQIEVLSILPRIMDSRSKGTRDRKEPLDSAGLHPRGSDKTSGRSERADEALHPDDDKLRNVSKRHRGAATVGSRLEGRYDHPKA